LLRLTKFESVKP